jgi:hypothetical protein
VRVAPVRAALPDRRPEQVAWVAPAEQGAAPETLAAPAPEWAAKVVKEAWAVKAAKPAPWAACPAPVAQELAAQALAAKRALAARARAVAERAKRAAALEAQEPAAAVPEALEQAPAARVLAAQELAVAALAAPAVPAAAR